MVLAVIPALPLRRELSIDLLYKRWVLYQYMAVFGIIWRVLWRLIFCTRLKSAYIIDSNLEVIFCRYRERNDTSLPIFTEFYRYRKTLPHSFAYSVNALTQIWTLGDDQT